MKDFAPLKELSTLGNKFFPYRVDPFLEGDEISCERVVSPADVSVPLRKRLQML